MSSTLFRPIPSTGQLPRVCVFDLDHTLIAGDATVDWTRYLLEEKLVTDPRFLEVDRLMEERYIAGTLLLEDYLREIIPFFSYLSMDELAVHGERFMARYIAPTVYQEGLDAIAEARRLGMDVMIISASNTFLVQPIGEKLLGIPESFGVDLATHENHLTGEVVGVPPFQAGKIHCLEKQLASLGHTLSEVVFFTDSRATIYRLREPLATATASIQILSSPLKRKKQAGRFCLGKTKLEKTPDEALYCVDLIS